MQKIIRILVITSLLLNVVMSQIATKEVTEVEMAGRELGVRLDKLSDLVTTAAATLDKAKATLDKTAATKAKAKKALVTAAKAKKALVTAAKATLDTAKATLDKTAATKAAAKKALDDNKNKRLSDALNAKAAKTAKAWGAAVEATKKAAKALRDGKDGTKIDALNKTMKAANEAWKKAVADNAKAAKALDDAKLALYDGKDGLVDTALAALNKYKNDVIDALNEANAAATDKADKKTPYYAAVAATGDAYYWEFNGSYYMPTAAMVDTRDAWKDAYKRKLAADRAYDSMVADDSAKRAYDSMVAEANLYRDSLLKKEYRRQLFTEAA